MDLNAEMKSTMPKRSATYNDLIEQKRVLQQNADSLYELSDRILEVLLGHESQKINGIEALLKEREDDEMTGGLLSGIYLSEKENNKKLQVVVGRLEQVLACIIDQNAPVAARG